MTLIKPPDTSETLSTPTRLGRARERIANWISPSTTQQASVSARVDDSPGWTNLTSGRTHDYDQSQVQELYNDALTAWRKSPIAWRIIAITTDYVVGDKIAVTSRKRDLQRFIKLFWDHPKNRMDLRLEGMSAELARAGDLFVTLHRNPADGLSYIRFVTKEKIEKIETAPDDWETELVYYETQDIGEPRQWVSPSHPAAAEENAIMLHYSVNKPIGALLGEGDLTTMLPWLQRYSRMLEDRVRLHWAVRAFLWLVTVPATKIREKQEQYRVPPDTGSIIVKDETEEWQALSPVMHASDAQHDLKAVRHMIDAGSGYPPHWRGEAADANLATATAMQAPTERHLARRQKYFLFIVQDILYHAYRRASEIGKYRSLNIDDYSDTFTVMAPDVSRSDNESLARASKDITEAMSKLQEQLPGSSATLQRLLLKLVLRYTGEPQEEDVIDRVMKEVEESPRPITKPVEKKCDE